MSPKSEDTKQSLVEEESALDKARAASIEAIQQDQTQVKYGAWSLILLGLGHLGMGAIALGGWSGLGAALGGFLGGASIFGALWLFWSAYGAFQADQKRMRMGLQVLFVMTLLSISWGRWWFVAMGGLGCLLAWIADVALGRVTERVEEKSPKDPTLELHHHLVPILVRVMVSDADIDQREHLRIQELCAPVDVSMYEHDYLTYQAQREEEYPIAELVKGYLQAAEGIPGLRANQALLAAVMAVVEADGVIAPEEVRMLREIGDLLGHPPEQIELLLRQMQTHIKEMDLERAAHLLGVSEEASLEEVEHAYRTMLQDFLEGDYAALGHQIEANRQKRRDVLEQAYMMMSEHLSPSK
ncbi:MAG: TerB family tellurite resistance protein [Myxococcales bacterium]|nr:TerB family tellurite resistance protein [Myxococcales bacterium]MCB9641662.1 TerB family tellurite resistance protein [Myxococcales bacterium]